MIKLVDILVLLFLILLNLSGIGGAMWLLFTKYLDHRYVPFIILGLASGYILLACITYPYIKGIYGEIKD